LATVGPQYPEPISTRHLDGNTSLENFSTMPVSFHTPSRFGPRHCGQSSPRQTLPQSIATSAATREKIDSFRMRFYPNLAALAGLFQPKETKITKEM
jgi:hypothetical protein